ncbi:hypothetical protein FisN_11Lh178 [Fistulifera solaris]|uniref:Uncharacterized protein n=1 Tax=Fistulifera solaris TaxID=1519565 RepID=A0A1Z5J771_FISSO|nr:hypothetical protein FisN_11Lh178 [Fistulifera solaris]|eukprot:GAX09844.1 hypothetical protein FisN_11Lh178 [Fistulifera solaris]
MSIPTQQYPSTYGEPADETVLLSLIHSYDWAAALARITTHPSESRIIGEQGRTPLLIACDHDAPAVVVHSLLKAFPEAAMMVGNSNMNALHITCSSNHASVHVTRILLEAGNPIAMTMMHDIDGDTPLHTACRCGAPIEVLEVLLRANPLAVHERDLEGLTPLLRLWVRYTVILGNDAIDSVNCAADLHGELLDAWKKTELLLRCTQRGACDDDSSSGHAFRPVHAACAVDCPRSVVRIAARMYPHQLEEVDEKGMTPLLIAAAAPVFKVRDLSDQGYTFEDIIYGEETFDDQEQTNKNDGDTDGFSQPPVIEIILNANQGGASASAGIPDSKGRLPLHVALESQKTWKEGVKQLVEVYPEGVSTVDPTTSLYPFMLAAKGVGGDLTTIYEICRLNPSLILDVYEKRNGST